MGHVYIPGLKVLEFERIHKKRILPLKGEVLVSKGDTVEPETIVARAFVPGDVEAVNVAGMLSVDPDSVEYCLKFKIGDAFKKNDVLAESKGFFGLFRTQIRTPFDGTLESISRITGQVVLRAHPVPVVVKGYIHGTVSEVFPNEGVEIESFATFIQGIFGIGGERFGTLMMLCQSPDEILDAEKIGEHCKGKIIVGGGLVTSNAIKKASELGVVGVVAGGIDAQDLKDFLGYDIGVAITGAEDINLTVIITEGFGKIPMAQRTFQLLQKCDGMQASINGATQIRAGVIRPEIIIHRTELPEEAKQIRVSETKGLEIGTRVRVIRVPYFGRIGQVVELPAEPQKLESETYARVCKIEFPDGTVVTVPRANLEMLEE